MVTVSASACLSQALLSTVDYNPAALSGIMFRDLLSGQQRGHVGARVRGPEVHEGDPASSNMSSNSNLTMPAELIVLESLSPYGPHPMGGSQEKY